LVALFAYGCPEFSKKLFKMVQSNLQVESWANKLRGKYSKLGITYTWQTESGANKKWVSKKKLKKT
jgi:hypothetical protein